jgi:hypothetical protein
MGGSALAPLPAVGIPDQVIHLISHFDRYGNDQPDNRRTVKLAANLLYRILRM